MHIEIALSRDGSHTLRLRPLADGRPHSHRAPTPSAQTARLVQAGPHGVVLRSSGSTLTIDRKGNITILAAKDVSIKARGAIYLNRDTVNVDEKYPAKGANVDTVDKPMG